MVETDFRGGGLRPQDQLARFNECQLGSPQPMRVTSATPAEFAAKVSGLDLGGVELTALTSSPIRGHRGAKLIKANDPGCYSMLLAPTGRVRVTQAGREATLGPNDLTLYDSSHPFTMVVDPGVPAATVVRAQFPKALLGLPDREVAKLLAVPIPGTAGAGALLAQFLTRLAADASSYRLVDLARLGGVAVDLVATAVAERVEAAALLEPQVRQRTQVQAIEAFIRGHLHRTDLTPGSIAAAHHISVSYLHRLFQQRGTTVTAWIRAQRLENARRDLADPAQRRLPVHRIAARWGFNDHSTFTRAFRAAFGLPPTEYRLSTG